MEYLIGAGIVAAIWVVKEWVVHVTIPARKARRETIQAINDLFTWRR